MQIDHQESGEGDGYGAQQPALRLGVRGYASRIFDDARAAWTLHRERHLIHWRAGSDLRVDRFDARNLLDDLARFRRLKRPRTPTNAVGGDRGSADGVASSGALDSELHALRYGDYAAEFPPPPPPVNRETPAATAFAYAYPEDRDDDEDDGVEGNGEAYEPPWDVPGSLEQPKSKKLHEIIAATARKAREHPQLEVMLKVKLSASARFGFLAPTHGFHAYYAFLRDENPPPRAAFPEAKSSNAVSLLGEEYGNDSDEDEEAVADAPIATDTKADAVAAKKAMRLKRVKLLAGHFQHAALEPTAHSPAALEAAARTARSPSPDESQSKRQRHQ